MHMAMVACGPKVPEHANGIGEAKLARRLSFVSTVARHGVARHACLMAGSDRIGQEPSLGVPRQILTQSTSMKPGRLSSSILSLPPHPPICSESNAYDGTEQARGLS
jgi:hypothetical protein